MSIWRVHTKGWGHIRLWRLENDQFLLIWPGEMKPFLGGPDYILLDEKYRKILSKLPDQVKTVPVSIIDKAKNVVFKNFIELDIKNEISHKTIATEPSDGRRLWRCGEYLFVSEALKNEFEKLAPDDFEFHEGFGLMVAG